MKSKLIELGDVKPHSPQFPILAKSNETGRVVLFISESRGMVVYVPPGREEFNILGEYSESWASCLCGGWTVLPPSTQIVITQ